MNHDDYKIDYEGIIQAIKAYEAEGIFTAQSL
jgi:hypothetical protein